MSVQQKTSETMNFEQADNFVRVLVIELNHGKDAAEKYLNSLICQGVATKNDGLNFIETSNAKVKRVRIIEKTIDNKIVVIREYALDREGFRNARGVDTRAHGSSKDLNVNLLDNSDEVSKTYNNGLDAAKKHYESKRGQAVFEEQKEMMWVIYGHAISDTDYAKKLAKEKETDVAKEEKNIKNLKTKLRSFFRGN